MNFLSVEFERMLIHWRALNNNVTSSRKRIIDEVNKNVNSIGAINRIKMY